jgi:aminopeptidase N
MVGSHRRLTPVVLALVLLSSACSSMVAGSPEPGAVVTATSPSRSTITAGESPAGTPTTSAGTAPSTVSSSPGPSGGVVAPGDDGSDGTIGNPGIGDPYYPEDGNGGYQIDSYDLNLRYDPDTNELISTATLAGTVLSDDGLTQFNLDLQPTMDVDAVTVNGAPAAFDHERSELVITPQEPLAAAAALAVEVAYQGRPDLVIDATGGLADGGWFRTQSGGAFVAGEPTSASVWYPVNEHPADPATFAVTATVPRPWQVISIGTQVTDGLPDPGPGGSVFRWELDDPVASYLTTIYIDRFTTVTDALDDGTPIVSAIAPGAQADIDLAEATKGIIEVLEGFFGPYPYPAAGGIFTGVTTGFALETASRPIYPQRTSFDTVVHELAHQWYGDLVTIQRWSDICLNECFASYAPWLYSAEVDGLDLDATWKDQMAAIVGDPGSWASPLVDMGAGNEFTEVYSRGPIALHALRNEIGDDVFLGVLRDWPVAYGGQNASFEDFEAFVSDAAGRDLQPFMDAWFRGTTVPAAQYRYPGDLGG